jgi:hypothetical protein
VTRRRAQQAGQDSKDQAAAELEQLNRWRAADARWQQLSDAAQVDQAASVLGPRPPAVDPDAQSARPAICHSRSWGLVRLATVRWGVAPSWPGR